MILLRRLALCLLLAVLGAAPALAQEGAGGAPPRAGETSDMADRSRSALPALSAAEAARLADLLRDDAKRAELIAALEALARVAAGAGAGAATPPPGDASAAANVTAAPPTSAAAPPAAERPPAPPPAPPAAATEPIVLPLAPDSLGAQLLAALTSRAQSIVDVSLGVARTLGDAPRAVEWLVRVASDPAIRGGILESLWKIAVLLASGIVAERLVILGLRPARQRLLRRTPQTYAGRLPLAFGDLLLDLVPVAAFALVAYSLIPVLERWPSRQFVLLVVANAYLVIRLARALGRLLFSPDAPTIRLIPRMSDDAAVRAQVWLSRITIIGFAGFAALETARSFGLDSAAHSGLLKALQLVLTILLISLVLQSREAVRDVLRAPQGSSGAWAMLRNRLAGVWHLLVIFYLLAAWVVTALEIEDGYGRIVAFTVTTILIIAAAKLAEAGLSRLLVRAVALDPSFAARHPAVAARIERYVPVLKRLLSVAVFAVALVALLQAWGLDALSLFEPGNLGHRLLGALVSIGMTALIALVIWEIANNAIQRRLDAAARDGQAARSARVRTLLPMLRTALMLAIVIVVALITLSEIGVNIAPLLAGAGVIGLAIGFGSQRLVQDLITGIFLLMEDAIAIGDVVNVAGQGGVVEGLSIRSIRLRSLDGTVHIIPFSAVTMVSNMTKDFAFAVFDIGVAYHEDTDRVAEVLRATAEEMRAEGRWAAVIREPLEILGVDRFADSAVVIRARFRTNAGSQWAVSREFNRRYKKAFDAHGIEIPFPYRKVVVASEDGAPISEEAKRAAAIAGAS